MEFLTGFAFGCIVLLSCILARDYFNLIAVKIFLLLAIASSAFLLLPMFPTELRWVARDLQVCAPALYWLLCQFTFSDKPKIKSVWALLALYSAISPSISNLIWVRYDAEWYIQFFGWKLAEYAEYTVILNGFWIIAANWSADLINARRRLRIVSLVLSGSAVFIAVISLNLGLDGDFTRSLVVMIPTAGLSFLLLQARNETVHNTMEIFPSIKQVTQRHGEDITDTSKEGLPLEPLKVLAEKKLENINSIKVEEDIKIKLDALIALMDDGFYKKDNLTLKQLAVEIDLPEYRLRTLINQYLGYRNFNHYINRLRINEAMSRLTAEIETPILNISLDIGYRSISTFNRVFKDLTGSSPTDYRESNTEEKSII